MKFTTVFLLSASIPLALSSGTHVTPATVTLIPRSVIGSSPTIFAEPVTVTMIPERRDYTQQGGGGSVFFRVPPVTRYARGMDLDLGADHPDVIYVESDGTESENAEEQSGKQREHERAPATAYATVDTTGGYVGGLAARAVARFLRPASPGQPREGNGGNGGQHNKREPGSRGNYMATKPYQPPAAPHY